MSTFQRWALAVQKDWPSSALRDLEAPVNGRGGHGAVTWWEWEVDSGKTAANECICPSEVIVYIFYLKVALFSFSKNVNWKAVQMP